MKSNFQIFFYLLIFLSLSSCSTETATTSVPDISVQWTLEKNYEQNGQSVHAATFTITNNASTSLGDNWEMYWNQSPRGIVSIDSTKNIEILWINGDYYRMRPKAGFTLGAKKTIEIKTIGEVWLIKEADGPVGVYLVSNPGDTETVHPIKDFKISPFTNPNQVTRNKNDNEPIPTAEYLFDQNKKLSQLDSEQWYKSIPSVIGYEKEAGVFDLDKNFAISCAEDLKSEALLLRDALKTLHYLKAPIKDRDGDIVLKIDPKIAEPEGYRIHVENEKIHINGFDKAGVFYGVQTLLNLIENKNGKRFINACKINDAPSYSYRGVHLDVSRNFQTKATLLKMIDVMASYKVNKIVLCMTEDEGWRIEIDGLPELTQIGSKRGHPSKDGSNLEPAYGSGPFTSSPTGSGFYTRADFKEIIQYAYQRHVDIIPMVNFPGHARAAIKSMEYRYNRLMKEGKEKEALQFRLIDPDDKSVYRSAQQYNDNIVCVCQPSTYDFYNFVIDDVIEMYTEAAVPLYMFQTGGDEVPRGAWVKSPICQEYLKQHPEIKKFQHLQTHFFEKATDDLQSKVDRIGGWEEVVMSYDDDNQWYTNTDFVDKKVYPYIWNNLWGQQDLGHKMANRGYPIILCNVTNLYFDLAYNKDPREPGLYWGGFMKTEDAFRFIPKDIFLSTTKDNMGNKLNPEKDFAGLEQITPEGLKNIVGIQGQLWSETVRGEHMFEYYILPKLMGFAQRAWQGQPVWGNEADSTKRNTALDADWNRFANTLSQKDFPKLEKMNEGYHYRIPSPGVNVENGKLMMNAAYPGMEIRYTIDGSDPTTSSEIYYGPIDFTAGTVIAKVFNGSGRSGLSTTFTKVEEQLLD
ncbi:MAG: hexosaminidase [Saprospiraceae bacterium]|jgi:hexosaminidase